MKWYKMNRLSIQNNPSISLKDRLLMILCPKEVLNLVEIKGDILGQLNN